MPMFEYQCRAGHRFERLVRRKDEQPASCPECSQEVRRTVSAPAFHLRGAGWYRDGYQKPE